MCVHAILKLGTVMYFIECTITGIVHFLLRFFFPNPNSSLYNKPAPTDRQPTVHKSRASYGTLQTSTII